MTEEESTKKKKYHQKLLEDGIFHSYPIIWKVGNKVQKEVQLLFGICPMCLCIGRNTSPCYSCNSVTIFQVPMVYEKEIQNHLYQSYNKTVYRVDTLFYAMHMSIYNSADPESVAKGYTTRDPESLLVPSEKQGEATYYRFPNEAPPTLRYMDEWCHRAYASEEHERHKIMHCLMTNQISCLFEDTSTLENAVYVRVFLEMINEWKVAINKIREKTERSLEFLAMIGPTVAATEESSSESDNGEDEECDPLGFELAIAQGEKKKQKR